MTKQSQCISNVATPLGLSRRYFILLAMTEIYMKILIIVNGNINQPDFYQNLIKVSDMIICADGGVNHCEALQVVPDFVIGDLDSADKKVLKELAKNDKTQIINDPDQDKTDLELAIKLAHEFDPTEIFIIGAMGDRMDHTLGNIISLSKIKNGIKAKIIDEKNEIELVENFCEIIGNKNDIVSVIPFGLVHGLNYEGLKWNVKEKDVDFGWFGICNRLDGDKAKINLESGRILVIRARD